MDCVLLAHMLEKADSASSSWETCSTGEVRVQGTFDTYLRYSRTLLCRHEMTEVRVKLFWCLGKMLVPTVACWHDLRHLPATRNSPAIILYI